MADSIDLNPFRRRLKKHGQAADALVRSSEMPKYQDASSSFMTYDYVVEVRPTGEEPFVAEVRDAFSAFMRPQPGDLVKVRFHPKSHKVAFDLDGDPRFDLSARGPDVWTGDAPRAAAPRVAAPAPARAPTADGADDLLTRLERLGKLRDSGVLTPEEFEAQKARLLDA